MESYVDDSETESERYDSPDDGDHKDEESYGPNAQCSLKTDDAIVSAILPSPCDEASTAPTRRPVVSPSAPWNNVLAFALTTPQANEDRRLPAVPPCTQTPAPAPFLSPFAVLEPHDVVQRETCPRCAGNLHEDIGPDGTVDDDTLLFFCVCCKRSLPHEQLQGDLYYALLCSPCMRASTASPDLRSIKLPQFVQIAVDVDAALRTEKAFFNTRLKCHARQEALKDPRLVKIDALDVAWTEAVDANMVKRRASFRDRASLSLTEASLIYDEWVSLQKQRVSLAVDRLQAMDRFLAQEYLQSPPSVAKFMTSIGLTAADPFPTVTAYDASEQCNECKVSLRPPGPVGNDPRPAAGFCDCCRRMLPLRDVRRVRVNSTSSICWSCRRRRGFSMTSDLKLVGIPDVDWCERLSSAVNRVGANMRRAKLPIGEAIISRLSEATNDVQEHRVNRKQVNGLQRRLQSVLRVGSTPTEESRRWYGEQSVACRRLVASAFKQLRISIEIGGTESDYEIWKPIVDLVDTQDGLSEHSLPKWLIAFINERWPKRPPAQAKSNAMHSQRPQQTDPPSQEQPKDPTQPNDVGMAITGSFVTTAVVVPAASTNTPPSPMTTPTSPTSFQRLVPPAVPSQSPRLVEHTCGCCAHEFYIQQDGGSTPPSFCDCCELVLPAFLTDTPRVYPNIQLCAACFQVQSKKSPEEVRTLAKRADDNRIARLWSISTLLKNYVNSIATTGAAAYSRYVLPLQQLDGWKRKRKDLRERQLQELGVNNPQVPILHTLYTEQVEIDAAVGESLLELIEVLLQIVAQSGIDLTPKIRKKIAASLPNHRLLVGYGTGETVAETSRVVQVAHGNFFDTHHPRSSERNLPRREEHGSRDVHYFDAYQPDSQASEWAPQESRGFHDEHARSWPQSRSRSPSRSAQDHCRPSPPYWRPSPRPRPPSPPQNHWQQGSNRLVLARDHLNWRSYQPFPVQALLESRNNTASQVYHDQSRFQPRRDEHRRCDAFPASFDPQPCVKYTCVGPDVSCERCAQGIYIPPAERGAQPSYCDCCELVLPSSCMRIRLSDPCVALCTTCFRVQSKKSPKEIKRLAKRAGDDRITRLSSTARSIKNYVMPIDAAFPPESSRCVSIAQEIERWERRRRQIREHQARELSMYTPRVAMLHVLYSEQVDVDVAMASALVEFTQELLEIVRRRGIEMSPEVCEMASKELQDHGVATNNGIAEGQGVVDARRSRAARLLHVGGIALRPQRPRFTLPEWLPVQDAHEDDHFQTRSRSRSPARYRPNEQADRPWNRAVRRPVDTFCPTERVSAARDGCHDRSWPPNYEIEHARWEKRPRYEY